MTEQATTVARCCDEYDDLQRALWNPRQTRAGFLKTTLGALAAAPLTPHMLLDARLAGWAGSAASSPILVVVQLAGGNDGLNSIVPYASDLYYHDRPNIAVPAKTVLPIDKQVGLNPNLAALKPFYDQGKLAIVQGVGYANPDRSHFRSTQIWATGDPAGTTPTGWLGRYLDQALGTLDNPMKALAVGPLVPLALLAQDTPVPSIENVNTFRFLLNRNEADPVLAAFRTMYSGSSSDLPPYVSLIRRIQANTDQCVSDLHEVTSTYRPAVAYPKNRLAPDLQLVAQLISMGIGTRVYHVTLGGFDDHVAEVYTHATLMKTLADSLAAFYQDLQAHNLADQVMTMTYSEFGRRVRENAGRGTDHGTAAPVFIMGGKVKGGLYGNDPVLGTLDDNGDLVYGIDFRSVYATVLDGWLEADSRSVLSGSFERLPFL